MYNIRAIVLEMLMAILEEHRPGHIVINETLRRYRDMDERDRAFAKKLCMGCIERLVTLDYLIDLVSKVKTEKQKPVIRNILRMGIYQSAYMNVTDFAACNEAVKLTGKKGFNSLKPFVNGVLRNFLRNKQQLMDFSTISDEVKRLSVVYSIPEWMVRLYLKQFTKERTERIFEYYLRESGTSVRCNSSKIKPEELEERLVKRGIAVEHCAFSERCFKISGYSLLDSIPEFAEGLFTVQDESSCLSGEIAGLEAGKTKDADGIKVLDLCAAPGGKSLNVADLLGGHGNITACDISEAKTALIAENVERCRFKNINILVNDATVYNDAFAGQFDAVIADVPCSGLGIIGKKPDIRYNASPAKISELKELVRTILRNAVKYVKPGGTLIFSTCTITDEENADNFEYLKSCGAVPVPFCIGDEENGIRCSEGYIRLLPGEYGTDGFFISKFRVVDEKERT